MKPEELERLEAAADKLSKAAEVFAPVLGKKKPGTPKKGKKVKLLPNLRAHLIQTELKRYLKNTNQL